MKTGALVLAAAAAALAPAPAWSIVNMEFKECTRVRSWSRNPEGLRKIVEVCSAAIQSGKLEPYELLLAYNYRAQAHSEAGAYPSAVADADQAVRLAPAEGQGSFVRARAEIHLAGKNASAALADFSTAVKWLEPQRDKLNQQLLVYTLEKRALAHESLGNVAAAIADVERALELAAIHDSVHVDSLNRERSRLRARLSRP